MKTYLMEIFFILFLIFLTTIPAPHERLLPQSHHSRDHHGQRVGQGHFYHCQKLFDCRRRRLLDLIGKYK